VLMRRMRVADLDQVIAIGREPQGRAALAALAMYEACWGRFTEASALVAEDRMTGTVGLRAAVCWRRRRSWSRLRFRRRSSGGGSAGNFFSDGGGTEGGGVREVASGGARVERAGARGFYRSLGWSETGRRPRYYADPEEDAVLMSLKLGEVLGPDVGSEAAGCANCDWA
jgi:hypothetical protein